MLRGGRLVPIDPIACPIECVTLGAFVISKAGANRARAFDPPSLLDDLRRRAIAHLLLFCDRLRRGMNDVIAIGLGLPRHGNRIDERGVMRERSPSTRNWTPGVGARRDEAAGTVCRHALLMLF